MKRYPILKNIHEFLQRTQKNEYILFEKEGVGHISVLMTNQGLYELVSYNERTDEYQSMFGHTEEFIDEIMADQKLI